LHPAFLAEPAIIARFLKPQERIEIFSALLALLTLKLIALVFFEHSLPL
jgi:hypothetical protein